MPSGPMRVLTILLLLAAASPPPQVATLLIAETSRDDPGTARKPPRARGRNRIGTPARPYICRATVTLAFGEARPGRAPRPLRHRHRSALKLLVPRSPSTSAPMSLRLRC